jgi:hypothetical protein
MKKFLFLVSILGVALALSSVPASATLLPPELMEGNPSCFDIPAIPITCDNSLKIGDPESAYPSVSDGTYLDNIDDDSGNGPLIVVLDVDGLYFDWESNIPVCAVIVKGGPNANVYQYWTYQTPVLEDSGLHAPDNGGTPYGLSHVDFCYGDTTPVPEPATMLLLGSGLIGLGALGRKKFFKKS